MPAPSCRLVKAATPGGYTFILPATKEVPRRLLHPRKKTVGVRIPDHVVTQALLAELGEPLLSSTLLLPDETEPLTQVTYHCDRLESAGLIVRRRQGREIYVDRTPRASILVELFTT
ncbi:Sua5/YciO/YrdC/YwlC family protein [Nonomuraea basaltis]|uniref:Sua5/YciO/YrdC/YwlC family protein n=1 Tax=Nonomuraea basaltis TaxID=2495887 RepID=UPI0023F454A5|nr:Sua5/YciO/YrdC/YwlC family protein [Nonomuraea basaltis]